MNASPYKINLGVVLEDTRWLRKIQFDEDKQKKHLLNNNLGRKHENQDEHQNYLGYFQKLARNLVPHSTGVSQISAIYEHYMPKIAIFAF